MLKNVLEMHINNLEDLDLKANLEGLLDQIVNDDGSLTYEDCLNIHTTVKSLFEQVGADEGELEESDLEMDRKKKKKSKDEGKAAKRRSKSSTDDLKPSKKKRKYQDEGEVEAGEIDDMYDDDQGQFQDLMTKKKY